MHSCDTRLCVNPKHLSVGSPYDNKKDAVLKLRHAYGERNGGGRKLKECDVRKIKLLHRDHGLGCSRLSKIFGVSTQTIKAINRGRIWRRITI